MLLCRIIKLLRHIVKLFVEEFCIKQMIPILLNAMYVLAKNPDVQSKTFEEIRTVSKGSKSLTKEMLNDLVYLKAVVRETFR